MPRLSDSMEEGTILRWLKSVGDEVKRGEELVEIETDKANMIYEATDEGTLIEIVAQEGDTLPIGEVIARVGDPGEVKGDGRPAAPKEEKKEKPERGATARFRTGAGARARATRRDRRPHRARLRPQPTAA